MSDKWPGGSFITNPINPFCICASTASHGDAHTARPLYNYLYIPCTITLPTCSVTQPHTSPEEPTWAEISGLHPPLALQTLRVSPITLPTTAPQLAHVAPGENYPSWSLDSAILRK